ncbi:hypothetical protein P7H59_11770 [Enterococcus viikkiensis]|uniref:Uncharacterized protein n=1 Tax=Enterococcus viikkiensis TaxID=930854 RepID=A0ABU3FT89_9ENTE|nr:hypothetical protein [Enterococcus viikkiensis]MDT2829111.1 hypothetical protein [Enterococcus viikkiensis]
MKILRFVLHLLQMGLLYGIYLMRDLYANHLGFMRNVSFYSHKFAESPLGRQIFLLPLVLVIVAGWLAFKKRTIESFLLLSMGLFFLGWQVGVGLEQIPIFYLVSGLLCLIFLLQLLIVLSKKGVDHGVFTRNH